MFLSIIVPGQTPHVTVIIFAISVFLDAPCVHSAYGAVEVLRVLGLVVPIDVDTITARLYIESSSSIHERLLLLLLLGEVHIARI
jgi:hypothetical protein